jgi:hypothetical protein
MNTSRLLGAICACLIAFLSASTNATEDVVHIAKNSNHDIAVNGIAPGDNQIKHSNISGVENSVFVISAGLIGFFLLRKANNV